MHHNLAHIASRAINEPMLIEPAYARVFFSVLGKEIGASQLNITQTGETLTLPEMESVAASLLEGGKQVARFYQVREGIAILPVTGTLLHKLGAMMPFYGVTGYDGITARLEQAMADPEVHGILLDIDSPGGQVAGVFDCADMIARLGKEKPIWALANDMACSAAMLLASACSRRLITQTGRMGSVGVLMVHTSYAGALESAGRKVTMIFAGSHKVEGNPYEDLPEDVRANFQEKIEAARLLFAEKVASFTGMPVQAVLDTEAEVYNGASAVTAGFADEIVNSADAVGLMVSALNINNGKGVIMNETQVEAATQERERVMGIIGCQEAKGREPMASVLASQAGMTVEQAVAILASAPQAIPVAVAAVESSEMEQILACNEAKGRGKLASALSAEPGMTLGKAKALLSAAPEASNGANAFEVYMAANSIQAVSTDIDGESPQSASLARMALFGKSTGGHNV